MRSAWELSILQATEARFTQPFLIGVVLQPSDHPSGPPLGPFQELHVLPVLEGLMKFQAQPKDIGRTHTEQN